MIVRVNKDGSTEIIFTPYERDEAISAVEFLISDYKKGECDVSEVEMVLERMREGKIIIH